MYFVKKIGIGLSLVSLGALAQFAYTQSFADFRIVVTVNSAKNEAILKCTKGCAWKDLSFSCEDSGDVCSSSINAYGMSN